MTDWDEMLERMHRAMQAVDRAHEAKETLREKANRDTLEKFQAEMQVLSEHLQAMDNILNHEDVYDMDELADAVSQLLNGKRAYRRIPPMETTKA